jgi:lysophospholipase L1-like esterase
VRRRVSTYVALGDSFTAGTGGERWADHVARALGPDVHYENLASFGATSRDVEQTQLGEALARRPDLVSLICGANDVLESVRPDPDEFETRLSRMFGRIRRETPEAALLTATYPDMSRLLPLRRRTSVRVGRSMLLFNEVIRRVAEQHGCLCLEGAEHPGAGDRSSFARDGFHPSAEGHRRAATDILEALEERLGIETRAIEEEVA